MKHVVFYSGGIGSWAAANRVAAQHGTEDLVLLFTDTMMEDEDLYRFLEESSEQVGGELVKIADGRDPWQIFRDVRFLGNSRVDPCSRILKRELARKWIKDRFEPDELVLYVGIDWTEEHRMKAVVEHWAPYQVEAPLTEPPLKMKPDLIAELSQYEIKPPRLYELGFPHNNCGGYCIKAGHAAFKLLLKTLPDRYAYHEEKEKEMREFLDADVAILRDRRGGESTPLTLEELRKRIEEESLTEQEEFDFGGCGCFL